MIHTCSYYCNRPACAMAQRNELRDGLVLPTRTALTSSQMAALYAKLGGRPAVPTRNESKVPTPAQEATLQSLVDLTQELGLY